MKLILTIRVIAGMDAQEFVIPLDLTGPATLKIKPSGIGIGNRISILDENGELREWLAHDLLGLQFEGP